MQNLVFDIGALQGSSRTNLGFVYFLQALGKIRAESNGESENFLNHDKGGYNTLLRHYSLVLNFQQPFLEATFQSR